jgi:hypothetical protein
MKEKLRNANSSRKSFSGPKTGRFHDLEQRAILYVLEKRSEGFPITREVYTTKALELSREMLTPANTGKFKDSTGWCVRIMRRAGLALRRRTTLAQRLPGEYSQKLLEFQRHVIKLRKQHSFMLGHIGNADQTTAYFVMPSIVTVNKKARKQF